MKKLFYIFLFLTVPVFGSNEKKINAEISKVTVYQRGAQIQRSGSYSINKGIQVIVIEGISPFIDPNSIQLTATGNIIILDSKYEVEYPQPEINPNAENVIPPKIKREIQLLSDSLFNISYEILELQYKIDVLNSEKKIIENNGTIKGTGRVNDSIPLLKDAVEYYHVKMNKINEELLVLQKKKILIERKQSQMNSRMAEYNNYNNNNKFVNVENKKPIHKILITVMANEVTSGRVNLSYLVNNAGWIPIYDIRSNGDKNSIDLTYKAQVYQNTGVKWDNIKLSLSTNNPYANKTKPELYPWYINYITQYNQQQSQKKSDINYKSTPAYSSQGTIYNESSSGSGYMEDQVAVTADKFTQIIEQLIDIEYSIDLPYTIESTNEKYMVLVNSKSLNTSYKYYTVPKLDLSTFLVAQITNLGDLNIVPGNANIFHDGAYLGQTYLNPNDLSDTMNLSLGKDQNIVTKRTLLKNDSKEKVVGDKIIKTYAYKIEVKNHKNTTVKITLQDQIPISQNTEIEIEMINGSKGKLNEVTGLLEWDLKLKSKETQSIDLVYTIKYSKTKNVNLASY